MYSFFASASSNLLSLVSTSDSDVKVEFGFSSGQFKTPAGSEPSKRLFLAAIPCAVGLLQGVAKRLRVAPCVKKPTFFTENKSP